MSNLHTSGAGSASTDREHLLRDARQRLTRLEIQTHELRAELARLEADGEEQAAARLAEQLRKEEEQLAEGRRSVQQEFASETRPSGSGPANQVAPVFIAPPTNAATRTKRSRGFRSKPRRTRTPAKQQRRHRSIPAWSVSLAAHFLIVVLLGVGSFGLPLDKTHFLLANAPDGEDSFEDFAEISLDPIEPQDVELEDLMEEISPLQPEESLAAEIDSSLESAALGAFPDAPTAIDLLASDLRGLMLAEPGGSPDGAAGRGAKAGGGASASAQFFGARSQGDRFVFVVDNSGSMTGGRLETTVLELMRSIGGMKPKQEFHVLFYSDQVYPMFFPEPQHQLLPATRENRLQLERWLTSVQMCKGDCLQDAMDYAASLEPHVVYLLSDGGYLFSGKGPARTKSKKLTYLTEETADWQFTIHTLGMTVRDPQAAEGLTLIARAHGGTFTPVGVLPIAAQLAKQKRIPYNRTPGAVWGSKVR